MNEPCCCDYYQLYNIPHTFIIARHQYDVEICEFVRDDDGSYLYGDHSDVELTIRVALRMKCGENIVSLTREQIKNSFWHEVFHAFNFYYNNRQDEEEKLFVPLREMSFKNNTFSYPMQRKSINVKYKW